MYVGRSPCLLVLVSPPTVFCILLPGDTALAAAPLCLRREAAHLTATLRAGWGALFDFAPLAALPGIVAGVRALFGRRPLPAVSGMLVAAIEAQLLERA